MVARCLVVSSRASPSPSRVAGPRRISLSGSARSARRHPPPAPPSAVDRARCVIEHRTPKPKELATIDSSEAEGKERNLTSQLDGTERIIADGYGMYQYYLKVRDVPRNVPRVIVYV